MRGHASLESHAIVRTRRRAKAGVSVRWSRRPTGRRRGDARDWRIARPAQWPTLGPASTARRVPAWGDSSLLFLQRTDAVYDHAGMSRGPTRRVRQMIDRGEVSSDLARPRPTRVNRALARDQMIYPATLRIRTRLDDGTVLLTRNARAGTRPKSTCRNQNSTTARMRPPLPSERNTLGPDRRVLTRGLTAEAASCRFRARQTAAPGRRSRRPTFRRDS